MRIEFPRNYLRKNMLLDFCLNLQKFYNLRFMFFFQELYKCKTELQYWRSKSTQLLSLPTTCSQCEAPLLPLGAAEIPLSNPDGSPFVFADLATLNDLNDLRTLANQVRLLKRLCDVII